MKNHRIVLLVLLGMLLILPLSCGKKGPPFLPRKTTSLKVEGLKGTWSGDGVRLTGTVPAFKKRNAGAPASIRCRIYHVRYDLEAPPCEGCPISFPRYRVVKGRISAEKTFSCRFPVDREDGIHYFQVRLIDPEGAVGPPSDRAALRVPK